MVTLLCLFCCITYTQIGFAQSEIGKEVMIYTKDRSIYRGFLIEENDFFIKLKIQTNDTLTIPQVNIRRVRYGTDHDFYKSGKSHKKTSYFINASVGLGSPGFHRIKSSGDMEAIAGIRITPRFSAGLSLSLNGNLFSADNGNANSNQGYFSIGGYGRYYLNQNQVKPFLFSQISYGFVAADGYFEEEEGRQIMFQNGIGFHFASKKRLRPILSLSHRLQHLKGRTLAWDFNNFDPFEYHDFNFWASSVVVKVGLEF